MICLAFLMHLKRCLVCVFVGVSCKYWCIKWHCSTPTAIPSPLCTVKLLHTTASILWACSCVMWSLTCVNVDWKAGWSDAFNGSCDLIICLFIPIFLHLLHSSCLEGSALLFASRRFCILIHVYHIAKCSSDGGQVHLKMNSGCSQKRPHTDFTSPKSVNKGLNVYCYVYFNHAHFSAFFVTHFCVFLRCSHASPGKSRGQKPSMLHQKKCLHLFEKSHCTMLH